MTKTVRHQSNCFHVLVSLRSILVPREFQNPQLPLVDDDGKVKTEPVSILERHLIPLNNESSMAHSVAESIS